MYRLFRKATIYTKLKKKTPTKQTRKKLKKLNPSLVLCKYHYSSFAELVCAGNTSMQPSKRNIPRSPPLDLCEHAAAC